MVESPWEAVRHGQPLRNRYKRLFSRFSMVFREAPTELVEPCLRGLAPTRSRTKGSENAAKYYHISGTSIRRYPVAAQRRRLGSPRVVRVNSLALDGDSDATSLPGKMTSATDEGLGRPANPVGVSLLRQQVVFFQLPVQSRTTDVQYPRCPGDILLRGFESTNKRLPLGLFQ